MGTVTRSRTLLTQRLGLPDGTAGKGMCRCIPQFEANSVDFIGFEFGMKKAYLAWRTASLLIIVLLVATLPDAPPRPTRRYSDMLFIHGWLIWLLLAGQAVEVAVIFYVSMCYPSRQIENPGIAAPLTLVWNNYKVIYPNIFSSAIMYGTFFYDLTYDVPQKRAFQHVVTLYATVHVITTGIPSHMGHVIGPAMFTVIYVIFSCAYQTQLAFDPTSLRNLFSSPLPPDSSNATPSSSSSLNHSKSTTSELRQSALLDQSAVSDPYEAEIQRVITAHLGERKPIYRLMDWDHWPSATAVALTWVLLTAACHVAMVFVAWRRRILFYMFRELEAQPRTSQVATRSSSSTSSMRSLRKTGSSVDPAGMVYMRMEGVPYPQNPVVFPYGASPGHVVEPNLRAPPPHHPGQPTQTSPVRGGEPGFRPPRPVSSRLPIKTPSAAEINETGEIPSPRPSRGFSTIVPNSGRTLEQQRKSLLPYHRLPQRTLEGDVMQRSVQPGRGWGTLKSSLKTAGESPSPQTNDAPKRSVSWASQVRTHQLPPPPSPSVTTSSSDISEGQRSSKRSQAARNRLDFVNQYMKQPIVKPKPIPAKKIQSQTSLEIQPTAHSSRVPDAFAPQSTQEPPHIALRMDTDPRNQNVPLHPPIMDGGPQRRPMPPPPKRTNGEPRSGHVSWRPSGMHGDPRSGPGPKRPPGMNENPRMIPGPWRPPTMDSGPTLRPEFGQPPSVNEDARSESTRVPVPSQPRRPNGNPQWRPAGAAHPSTSKVGGHSQSKSLPPPSSKGRLPQAAHILMASRPKMEASPQGRPTSTPGGKKRPTEIPARPFQTESESQSKETLVLSSGTSESSMN